MLGVPGSIATATRQPPGPSIIDWSNPITRDLVASFTPSKSALIGLSSVGVNELGRFVIPDATRRDIPPHSLKPAGSFQTLVAVVRSVTGSGMLNVGHGDSVFFRRQTATTAQLLLSTSASGDAYTTVFNVPDRPFVLIIRTNFGGFGVIVYVDGIQVHSQAFNGTCKLANATLHLGGNAFANGGGGHVSSAALYTRDLSLAEISSLSKNPWQIFSQVPYSLWVPQKVITTAATITGANTFLSTSNRQPPGVPKLNYNDQIAKHVVGIWSGASRYFGAFPNERLTGGGSNQNLIGTTRNADGLVVTSGVSSPNIWEAIALNRRMPAGSPFTFVVRFRVVSLPGSTMPVARFDGGGEWSGIFLTSTGFIQGASVRANTTVTSDLPVSVGDYITAAYVARGGDIRLWVNGVKQSSVGIASLGVFTVVKTNFENYYTSNIQVAGKYLLNTALDDKELISLSNNFWRPYDVATRPLWAPQEISTSITIGGWTPGNLAQAFSPKTQGQKPAFSSSLLTGLKMVIDPNTGVDLLGQIRAKFMVGTRRSVDSRGVSRGYGPTLGTSSSDSLVTNFQSTVPTGSARSYAARIHIRSTGGGGFGRVFHQGPLESSLGSTFLFCSGSNLNYSSTRPDTVTTGQNTWSVPQNKTFDLVLTDSGSIATLGDVKIAPNLYIDGTSLGNGADVAIAGTTNPATGHFLYLGNRGDGLRNFDGTIGYFFVWDRELTPHEAKNLSANIDVLLATSLQSLWAPRPTIVEVSIYRPASDVVTAGWTATPGPAYFDAIDETTPDDADYVTSQNSDIWTPFVVELNAPLPEGTWDLKVRSSHEVGVDKRVYLYLLNSFNQIVGETDYLQTNRDTFENNVFSITTTGVATKLSTIVVVDGAIYSPPYSYYFPLGDL